jgi:hypothetical protein
VARSTGKQQCNKDVNMTIITTQMYDQEALQAKEAGINQLRQTSCRDHAGIKPAVVRDQ